LKGQVNPTDLPVVIVLHQDGAGEAQAGSLIRENANHASAAVDFAVEAFQTIGGAQFALMAGWESEHRQSIRFFTWFAL
jgi:hypothetical protein